CHLFVNEFTNSSINMLYIDKRDNERGAIIEETIIGCIIILLLACSEGKDNELIRNFGHFYLPINEREKFPVTSPSVFIQYLSCFTKAKMFCQSFKHFFPCIIFKIGTSICEKSSVIPVDFDWRVI